MNMSAKASPEEFVRAPETLTQGRRVIEFGVLRIDADAHRVHVGAREVPLTWLEFKLLVTLAERPDRVQPRGQLLSEVWRVKPGNATRTVDTHVKRLRDKLGVAGGMIQTVRGVGYRLSEAPSVQEVDGRCIGRGCVGRDREGGALHGSERFVAPSPARPVVVGLTAFGGRSTGAPSARAARTTSGSLLPVGAARCDAPRSRELDRAADR
jgi:DNA-binding winged helix-turn-helix (wHTH) protein